MGLMVLGVLLVLVILILAANIRIVPQAHAYILERLGGYKETWGVGIHFKIPILDRVAKRVSLKEQVVDFEPQAVITKDNVTMQIDTVIFFQITDPKQYAYGVENPIAAIENLTATTLRNIIQRDDQFGDAHIAGYRYRPVGNQGESCGTEKYHASDCNPGCDGETDEGRT